MDNTATDLKVEYTYCLGFFKTKSTKNPARIVNFIYSDRVSLPDAGRNLGVASVVDRVCADSDWRVSYRKDEPEKEAIPEALLQRRLQAQKQAKSGLTSRRQPVVERLLAEEKQRAHRSQKAHRERLQFQDSSSSSSSSSDSSDA